MTQVDKETNRKKPEIFSRGALELTFRLMRKRHPGLALAVQNVLAGKPLPGSNDAATDHFHVSLEARTVGKIVAALTEMGQHSLEHNGSSAQGRRVVIKTLIHEWIALAEWIIIQAGRECSSRN
ncbi:hypothetical protein FKG94_24940 [Exilibacterium tricleocarpae]|uniref:Uncharacterized protein n=1 Tax=Exilibacterium tricleocarpae TaxID=2591008 RepID=A0A545SS32_9GAMM|nr:hypothetical protein [Exilibacterium tricleocarpae]TQV67778.1 hypothetical protein FKG94_24940 [Exilibacterium tricleocarpae]